MKLQNSKEISNYSLTDYKSYDSQMLIYTAPFLGRPLKERISSFDLLPAFYAYHGKYEEIKIFLLGTDFWLLSNIQDKINSQIERSTIVGSYSPSFEFEKNEQECNQIVEIINHSSATVLAIGVGVLKQENWIYKYNKQLPNLKVLLVSGATINFEADQIKRVPKWINELGFEWLYKLLTETKRLFQKAST